jgi:hypothetical protein
VTRARALRFPSPSVTIVGGPQELREIGRERRALLLDVLQMVHAVKGYESLSLRHFAIWPPTHLALHKHMDPFSIRVQFRLDLLSFALLLLRRVVKEPIHG